MKTRIFKLNNGKVAYCFSVKGKQLSECKFPSEYDELEYCDVEDSSVLKHPNSKEGEYFEALFFDGNCELGNLKYDSGWNVQLMPDHLIKRKQIEKLKQKLDGELAKQTPDAIIIAKTQRECEKLKGVKAGSNNDNLVWTNIALQNLDERVAKGEPDKPLIRQKLLEKQSLSMPIRQQVRC